MRRTRTIHLWGGLRPAAGGASSIEIEADTIRDLMRELDSRFPDISQQNEGIAVSVNGTIYRDDWSQKLPLDAEIYLLPRIAGG